MRSTIVLQGIITNVSELSQQVEITDHYGVMHTQEIHPNLPEELWLSTRAYLRGYHINVIEVDGGSVVTVVQPDVLVDVSEAAAAVGTSHAGHLVRRLRTSGMQSATLQGLLVNGVFDLLVQNPTMTDDECVRIAASTRPLSMALLARSGEAESVGANIRACLPALRAMLAEWDGERLDLEPFYMSPRWGLQGRADILRVFEDHIVVVEMKAGKPPSQSSVVRPDHAAQVAGYAAIMGSIMPTTSISTSVWYVKAGQDPIRDIDARSAIGSLIAARNALVLSDAALQQRSAAPLQWLSTAQTGGSSYEYHATDELRHALRRCEDTELLAVRAWMSMAAQMHAAMRRGGSGQRSLADVWSIPREDKQRSTVVLMDLTVDQDVSQFNTLHIVFRAAQQRRDSSLRVGDQVIVYPQPSDTASPCDAAMYKGVIREISPFRICVALRNKFIDRGMFARDPWVVEQDVMDSSARSLYAGLRALVDAEPRRRAVLLGRVSPTHDTPSLLAFTDCTAEQQNVIERALASRELFLIQGPPGTGKTSTIIRCIIQHLVAEENERVLAVAYTNRAANELCAVLDRKAIPYVRHGSVEGAEGAHALPLLARTSSATELGDLVANARCIVATIQSMYSGSEIWEFGDFTTVIVDEASQIIEPALLGITTRVPRVILVGDQCQLPPVLTLPSGSTATAHPGLQALGLASLDRSAFERLVERAEERGDTASFAMLTQQGRMHADIMHVVSEPVYDGELETLLPWQQLSTQTPWSELLPARAVFVPVVADEQAEAEASCIVRLVCALAAMAAMDGWTLDLGIITPFRVQNNRIRDLLPAELREYITVDTVERFQGSERDIIVYGTSVANQQELESIESPFDIHGRRIDRKLNVAVTRARQQLVIVGNDNVVLASAAYRNVVSRLMRIVDLRHGRTQ